MRFYVLALMLLVPGYAGCHQTPYQRLAWGFRSVAWTADLGEQADAALKAHAEVQRTLCLEKHAAVTPEYAGCIKPTLELLRTWTGESAGKPTGRGVLPALQSAQRAARFSLNAAYDYIASKKGKCNEKTDPQCAKALGEWKVLIKPGFCALVALVDRAVQIGAYKATTDPAYQAVKSLATGICN